MPEPLNVLELFAGIGGLSLGLQRAGMRIVGHVEINPFCRAVLHKHWPEVPSHDDVHTTIEWWHSQPRPHVDILAGGYPCQPDSLAGRRLGDTDPRWLWPAMAEVIAELRPPYVLGENVLGHRTRGLRQVLADLRRLGYAATAGIVRACEVGAPHPRPRLFVLAHTAGQGRPARRIDARGTYAPARHHQDRAEPARGGWWADEPRVDRVAYGLPDRMDRATALGNAVVPHVAERIGRIILDHQQYAAA